MLVDAIEHARDQNLAGRHDWGDDQIILDALEANRELSFVHQRAGEGDCEAGICARPKGHEGPHQASDWAAHRAGEPPTPDEVERAASLEAALRHALSEAEAIATGAPEESHIPAYQEMALSIVLQARAALKAIR